MATGKTGYLSPLGTRPMKFTLQSKLSSLPSPPSWLYDFWLRNILTDLSPFISFSNKLHEISYNRNWALPSQLPPWPCPYDFWLRNILTDLSLFCRHDNYVHDPGYETCWPISHLPVAINCISVKKLNDLAC